MIIGKGRSRKSDPQGRDDPYGTGRIPFVLQRLKESASRYVLVKRFSSIDRCALRLLIDAGHVELFQSPLGNSYRLTEQGVFYALQLSTARIKGPK